MKRIKDFSKILPIVELYTAVQSEGNRAGYPTVVIRTTGCTHRCFFGAGGWCDSWQTSIHPEKGSITFNDIVDIYEKNPHITEMMLTGGSPTMHPALVNELTYFAHKNSIFITMETEGSHFIKTDYPIDLLSISPKFSNSIPKLGVSTPMGSATTERMVSQHNKLRLNLDAITDSISYHKDFHIKPVWDGEDEKIMSEIAGFLEDLTQKILNKNTLTDSYSSIRRVIEQRVYLMPAGDSREALFKSYAKVFDWVRDNGYKMTWRPHIMAFENQRFV